MKKSVHGHEVLRMIAESKHVFMTKKSLEDAIIKKFGKEVRFHTCSMKDLTAKELIDFLDQRGKFIVENEGITTDKSKICDHE